LGGSGKEGRLKALQPSVDIRTLKKIVCGCMVSIFVPLVNPVQDNLFSTPIPNVSCEICTPLLWLLSLMVAIKMYQIEKLDKPKALQNAGNQKVRSQHYNH
jgi:hypothetical protein